MHISIFDEYKGVEGTFSLSCINNGPAIFQRVMNHVLWGLDCADSDVYIADIIVGSSGDTEEEVLPSQSPDVPAVLGEQRRKGVGCFA